MDSVYIETSVVSYLTARISNDLVVASRQRLTREWWANRRGSFQCVTSQEVLDEASAGDSESVARRVAALRDIPRISGGIAARQLAVGLMTAGLFPPNAAADALHLTTATLENVDYLLTWNYRHLANAVILHRLEKFLAQRGLMLPRVCTPEELGGE
jgi:hypothetical protein